MSELRRDPFSGGWVVVAPERARRAAELRRPRPAPVGGLCPFCPGAEALTPHEVYAARPGATPRDGPGWTVRVVPNPAPALRVEGELSRDGEGPFDRVQGIGAHEVVVETARHDATLATYSPAELEGVFAAWQARLRDLAQDGRLRSIAVFRSEGEGGLLEHPHSQLVALPLLAPALARELARTREHFERTERCLACDVVGHERRDGARVVAQNELALAYVPFAASRPFELHLVPRRHASHLEHEGHEVLAAVASLLSQVVRRLEGALGSPPHQLLLRSGPLREPALASFHWRLELVPQLALLPALEAASGLSVNPVAPEEAARFLREHAGELR